jgi:WD40 repeat protein
VTRTVAESPSAARASPFQGLTHFSSDDERYFFGRDVEREILEAQLIVSRLTIVYGPSGVGKSSLLGAGVEHDLREEAKAAVAEGRSAEHVVVLYSGPWEGDAVRAIDGAIAGAVRRLYGSELPPRPDAPFDEVLERWSDDLQARLLIILDQFESYLIHADTEAGARLDRELPRAVMRTDLDADFMIAIREDALAGLDRFKTRIPILFDTRVRIDHLDRGAAAHAIRDPIARWNDEFRRGLPPVEIEDELVEAVLDQVRTGEVVVGRQGRGTRRPSDRIETAHLQLVMERVWEAEDLSGERPMLRLETLERLGGAREIVVARGREAIRRLPLEEQRVVAAIFDRLVTPSGAKIAHSLDDLAKWAKTEPRELQQILDTLSAGDLRILRPAAPASGAPSGPRYELFHDVLATAILDWQAEYEREQEQEQLNRKLTEEAAERQRAEEQARHARRQAAVAVTTAAAALGLLALVVLLWRDAQQRTATARSLALASAADLQRHDHPHVALLLGLEAYRWKRTWNATNSTVAALESLQASGASRILHGHSGVVNNIALSPNGKTLLSAGGDATVRMWDVGSGTEIDSVTSADLNALNAVTFSPDGRRFASAGDDGRIYIWTTATRRLSCTILVDQGTVHAIAFIGGGQTLVSGSDGGLQLWDVRRPGSCGWETRTLGGHRPVDGLAVGRDGRTLAVATTGAVEVWRVSADPAQGPDRARLVRTLRGHGGLVDGVAFARRTATLVSSGDDGTVRLWDVRRGNQIGRPLLRSDRAVYSVSSTPDGSLIVAAGVDGLIRAWSPSGERGKLRLRLLGNAGAVRGVLVADAGHTVFAAAEDGTIRIWRVAARSAQPQLLNAHTGLVNQIAFSPKDATLAAAGDDGAVRFWDLHTKAQSGRAVKLGPGHVNDVAYSPDGRMLVAAYDDTIRVIDVARRVEFGRPLGGHRARVTAVAYSPNGDSVASSGDDGTIRLWDVGTHAEKDPPLKGFTQNISDVAFSPDGHVLASAGEDWTARLWDLGTPTKVGAAVAHGNKVNSVAFSPDGKKLGSAGDDGIRLWDAHSRSQLGNLLSGDTDFVHSIAFSPDGRFLASGAGDVRLWDVGTGRMFGAPLNAGPDNLVTSVAFSADGRVLAAATGQDGTIRVWDGLLWRTYADLQKRVCRLLGTGLSRDEWERYAGDLPYHQSCP